MKYRKKTVVIEAMQWDGTNAFEINEWSKQNFLYNQVNPHLAIKMIIPTLEGIHIAQPGDWIIKGIKGEFYPCTNSVFENTYEKVKEGSGVEECQ